MQVQILTWQLSAERIKPTSKELVETYNAIAHQWQRKIQRLGYDRAYTGLFAQLHDNLRDHFAKRSTMQNTNSVLDCGVGTGALSAALYKSDLGDLTFHGVDTSPAMSTAARIHLARQGIPMQIRTQDVRDLSYADNAFDMVMAAHTIEHLPEPQRGVREMVRVLRSDAPLLIVTTRPSFLGALIDVRWGLNCLKETALATAFKHAGLRDVRLAQLGGPVWCRRMSYAAIGWKR